MPIPMPSCAAKAYWTKKRLPNVANELDAPLTFFTMHKVVE